ncbi:hypothetical protein M9H77_18329 [Catharanthus roseus]|uniref:Uncharacterized protein n=1 Tax=Catharanthus roseus TaxID=4058 RepID=A0ACC0B755_CATRO|nr:hypothetical protein M9H77_18329 [Catharanthus roseus]
MRAKYGDPILIFANPISVRVSDSHSWIRMLKVIEEIVMIIVSIWDAAIQDSWNGLFLRSLVLACYINDILTVSPCFSADDLNHVFSSYSFAQEVWSIVAMNIGFTNIPWGSFYSRRVLHSSTGELYTGFPITLVPTTSNSLAEAKGILYGLKLIRSIGFSDIQVQSDSMLRVQLLTGKARTRALDCCDFGGEVIFHSRDQLPL